MLELQALLGAANAVQAQAAATSGLTMAQLGLLGVVDSNGVALSNSVDATTQQAILAKIAAAVDSGTETDTVAEIQALVNSINLAPVINNPLLSVASLGGLFGSTSSYGTAVAGPEIQGPGWNTGQPTDLGAQFGTTGWSTIHSPDLLSPSDNPWLQTLYGIHGVEGTSTDGGNFAAFLSTPSAIPANDYEEGITTTLSGLVIGQTYSFVAQWQQIAYTQKNAEAIINQNGNQLQDIMTFAEFAGGSLNISVSGGAVTKYTSSGLIDGWQTAVYTFQATSASETLTLQHSGQNNLASLGWGAIGVDSLSVQQTQDYLSANAVASGGMSVGTVFGPVSDSGQGATLNGWAITSAATDASGHHWQYSSDNGTSWANMDAASASQAIYLSTTDLIRWTGIQGTNTELDAKAVDNTGPALHAANAAATVVDASVSGGSTAFSGNTAVLAAHAAPLVFDLNHDGKIDYSTITMGMDGHAVNTAWAGPADGILVWDKYDDGQVHGSDQYVFGQNTGSDLTGLRLAFDSNHDSVFDAKDAKFNQFGVWQDANQNGTMDAGEFHSLAQLGVSALALEGDGKVSTPANGVTVNGNTMATLADGSTMLVTDATFSYVHIAAVSGPTAWPHSQVL